MAEKVKVRMYVPSIKEVQAALKVGGLTSEQRTVLNELLNLLNKEKEVSLEKARLYAEIDELGRLKGEEKELIRLHNMSVRLVELQDRESELSRKATNLSMELEKTKALVREKNERLREISRELGKLPHEDVVRRNEKLRNKKRKLLLERSSLRKEAPHLVSKARRIKDELKKVKNELKRVKEESYELMGELIAFNPELDDPKLIESSLREKIASLSMYDELKLRLIELEKQAPLLKDEIRRLCSECDVDFFSPEVQRAMKPQWLVWKDEMEDFITSSKKLLKELESRMAELRKRADEYNEIRKSDLLMTSVLSNDAKNLEDSIVMLVNTFYQHAMSFSGFIDEPKKMRRAAKGLRSLFKSVFNRKGEMEEKYKVFQVTLEAIKELSSVMRDVADIKKDELAEMNPELSPGKLERGMERLRNHVAMAETDVSIIESLLRVYSHLLELTRKFQDRFKEKEMAWDSFERTVTSLQRRIDIIYSLDKKLTSFNSLLSQLHEVPEEHRGMVMKKLRRIRKEFRKAEEELSLREENYDEGPLLISLKDAFDGEYQRFQDILTKAHERIEEINRTIPPKPDQSLKEALDSAILPAEDIAPIPPESMGVHTIWQKMRWLWGLSKATGDYLKIVEGMFGEKEFASLYERFLPISYPGLMARISVRVVSELMMNGTLPENFKVLDAGSGPSTFTRALREAGIKADVTDLDISEEMLNKSVNERRIRADMATYVPKEKYDLLNFSCSFQLLPLSKRAQTIYNLGSGLREGGVLLITLPPTNAPGPAFTNALNEMGFRLMDEGRFKTILNLDAIKSEHLASVRRIYRKTFGDELGRSIVDRLRSLLEKEVCVIVAVKERPLSVPKDPLPFALGEEGKKAESPMVREAINIRYPDPELARLDEALMRAIEKGNLPDVKNLAEVIIKKANAIKKAEKMTSSMTTLHKEGQARWRDFVQRMIEEGKERELEICFRRITLSGDVEKVIEGARGLIFRISLWLNEDLKEENFRRIMKENLKEFHSQLTFPDNDEMKTAHIWVTEGEQKAMEFADRRKVNFNRVRYLLEDSKMFNPYYLLSKEHRELLAIVRIS